MMHPLLFLVGYDVISVPVSQSVDFMNICAAKGLVYHSADVKKKDSEQETDRYYFLMSSASRLRATLICEARGIDLRTESRHGIPELMRALVHRPGVILGAALFFTAVYFSGNVIWDIRVEGNSRVSEEQIENILLESGIRVGSKKAGLDIDAIQTRALILSDEISWITVNVTGTVAEVEVRETSPAPDTPDHVASNLVATQNGTVVEFEEVRGNIAVELGEAVSKGQLLVGGVYGDDTSATRFVRSRGRVIALCEREYRIQVPMNFEKKIYTGRQKIKKSLIFFDKEVKFFINSGNSYASCDTINTVEYFNFFGLGQLPFGIRTVRYVEYGTQTAQYTEQQAAEQANYLLWQKLYEDAPQAQLVGKTLNGRVEGETYILDALIKTHENIAKEVEIEVEITG